MAADLDVEVVGREFVRQYYTVLNQRPDCLHQFFTKDSSFVHGGVERPGEEQPACQGQAIIHQKILSLNFRDCHTKIRQVDCQKTVGNAVLVQVSGELSNNGEPMRKFMQSFVLVQQAPKNFYVHNDIFRYQDEVFHDYHYAQPPAAAAAVVAVHEAATLDNEAKICVNHEVKNVSEQEVSDHHPPAPENVANGNYTPPKDQQLVGGVVSLPTSLEISPSSVAGNHTETANLNGSLQEEPQTLQSNQQDLIPENKEPSEQGKSEEIPAENGGNKEVFEEKNVQAPTQPQQQKFFSWASMASKNTSSSTSTTPQNKPQATIKPERKSEIVASSQAVTTPPSGVGPRHPNPPQPRTTGTSERKWSPAEGEEGGFKSPPAFVPDNQQLFIGNLPHSITEQEVKELFEKFGNVIDIKINRKGATRDLPNFGFVAFDGHEAVARAMKARPIMFGKRRINIEEKKDQSSVANGPRRVPARGGRGGVRGGSRTAARVNGGAVANQVTGDTEKDSC